MYTLNTCKYIGEYIKYAQWSVKTCPICVQQKVSSWQPRQGEIKRVKPALYYLLTFSSPARSSRKYANKTFSELNSTVVCIKINTIIHSIS